MSHKTFVIAVISPNQRVQEHVTSAFEDCAQAGELWSITDYPTPDQLSQFRDSPSPSVVYLDFANAIRAKGVAYELDRCPNTVVIAIVPSGRGVAAEELEELLELGVRSVLPAPLEKVGVMQAFHRAVRKLDYQSEADRGGARCTRSCRYGPVMDALACNQNLDSMWDHIVCNRGPLDILRSATDGDHEVALSGITNVIDFARLRYRTVCVDLPGEISGHELPVLKAAKEIFLVCTPELGALHQARRKSELLQSLGHGSRTTVILNRAHGRNAMSIGDIEDILQLQVRFTVPNGEREVTQATVQAIALEGRSPVARQIEAVARHMMPVPDTASFKVKARRFLETFSVTPAREKAGWWR